MNKVTRIKNANYTTISNVFLRDKELSLKAKGLLATILSLPETWDFSIKGICSTIKEGATAVYSAIDELKERGYCKVATNRNEKGMIVGTDYTFYEDPNVENLNVGNQSQINTNISLPNTNETYNKEIKKEETKELKEKFANFVFLYKKSGGKVRGVDTEFEEFTKRHKDWKSVVPYLEMALQRETKARNQAKANKKFFPEIKNLRTYLGKQRAWELYVTVGEDLAKEEYTPMCGGALNWNDYYNCYMYVGFWNGKSIADGYSDDTRPDGASITLNNGRGTIVWDKKSRQWIK